MTEQQKTFWDVIEVFQKAGLLPYVMLIGSWAEYIYQNYLLSDFQANLRTRDADFLYHNLRKPQNQRINIYEGLKEKGFVYVENRLSGVGKFVKEDLLELEFLTRALGLGQHVNEIPSMKLKAAGLREVNMLTEYPLKLDCNGYTITVPEPEAYVLQKLLINKYRKAEKKEKDIQSVMGLMRFIDKTKMRSVFEEMSKKNQVIVTETMNAHFIVF